MREKVLVIDDDPPSGKAMMWAMEAMGHEVYLVHDGYSALHAIRDFVPGVVLCDIKMPGMLGYEVCEKMRTDSRLKDTLFIAQTGLDSPLSRQKCRDSGFSYHLIKPIDVNELLQLVYLERERRNQVNAGRVSAL